MLYKRNARLSAKADSTQTLSGMLMNLARQECVELCCQSCYIIELFEFHSPGGPVTVSWVVLGISALICYTVSMCSNVRHWDKFQNNSEMLVIIVLT